MKKFKVTIFNRFAPSERHTDIIEAETIAEAERDALGGGLVNYASGWGLLSSKEVDEEHGDLTPQQVEGVKERVSYLIGLIIPDHVECGDVTYGILKEVCEDIAETADWDSLREDECCEGDIDIAVSRVMYGKVFPQS